MDFKAPIPGQSLTTPPKQHPYERTPEISDPEEALQMHLSRLGEEDMRQHLVQIVEVDPEEMDVKTLTTGLLRSAVSEGIHSIDVSLVIAPVVHEFITQILELEGVDYEEGLVDKKEKEKSRKIISEAKAERFVKESLNSSDEEPVEEDFEEKTFNREVSSGFVKRRNK